MADVKEVDSLLENVEQFVNDEHKIVGNIHSFIVFLILKCL